MDRFAIGLQVSLDVAGRHAVVLGGGAEAEDKVARLLDGGAWVTVFAPLPSAALVGLADAGQVRLERRPFEVADADTADLLLVCDKAGETVARAKEAADERGLALWVVDAPEVSHLAMPALARLGRARIAVTTGGAAPALAGKIRAALEVGLGERFAAFVDSLQRERERILAEVDDADERRRRLRALVDDFSLEVVARYPS